jgi:O-methyltransferase involved in polyketide biosynthesis
MADTKSKESSKIDFKDEKIKEIEKEPIEKITDTDIQPSDDESEDQELKKIEQQKPKKKFVFKEYYKDNPEFAERHREKMKTKYDCPCGRTILRYQKLKHERTQVHKRYEEQKEKEEKEKEEKSMEAHKSESDNEDNDCDIIKKFGKHIPTFDELAKVVRFLQAMEEYNKEQNDD